MRRWNELLSAFATAAAILFAGSIVVAQGPSGGDALPPAATVRLTQEQRHIIKEIILKDLRVKSETASVPTKIGDVVPSGVPLQPIPVEVSAKVPQVRTHAFYVKDDRVVLVDTKDNKIADVVE